MSKPLIKIVSWPVILRLKTVLPVFYFLSAFTGMGQDTSWKKFVIDENMTSFLPANAELTDTVLSVKNIEGVKGRFLIFKAKTERATFGVTVSASKSSLKQSRRELYRELETGFRERARQSGFQCEFSDTTLDGVNGRKVVMSDRPVTSFVTKGYFFIIKGIVYNLVFTPTSPGAEEDIGKLLSGCRFTVDPSDIEPMEPKNKYTGVSNWDLLISLCVTILIVGLIVVMVNRKSRNRKLNL
jgi:hypothetical protein